MDEPLSPKTKMILASMNAVDDSESDIGSSEGSYNSYSGSDFGSEIVKLGSQDSCRSYPEQGEPEPEQGEPEPELSQPEMLPPEGLNIYETYDRRIPNYSGLNIINGFYKTKNPESTFPLQAFLQNAERVYGLKIFFKFNNEKIMKLKNGIILDPENKNDKEYLESILTNVLQWISEFNNSRNSENCSATFLFRQYKTLFCLI